jgi:uncharacterized protein YndB with AHSA1/START domain
MEITMTSAYDWTQFTQRIVIKAPPAKVFKAWTDPSELIRWFPVKAELEPKKGGRLYLEWLAGDKFEGKIIRVRKPSLLVFPFGNGNEEVEVKISKVRGGPLRGAMFCLLTLCETVILAACNEANGAAFGAPPKVMNGGQSGRGS